MKRHQLVTAVTVAGFCAVTAAAQETRPSTQPPSDVAAGRTLQESTHKGWIERPVPDVFTASGTLDVGLDPCSRVSSDYHDRAPFGFNDTINKVQIRYLDRRETCSAVILDTYTEESFAASQANFMLSEQR